MILDALRSGGTGLALAAADTLNGVGFIRSHFLGQGEYSGLDILDIIVLVLVAAVLVQMLRRGRIGREQGPRADQPVEPGRPASRGSSGPSAGSDQPIGPEDEEQNLEARHARARAAWARLAGQGPEQPASRPAPADPSAAASGAAGGFDEHEFLSGAKAVFARIQAALGRGDFSDVADFVAGDPRSVLQDVAARWPAQGEPEIVLLEAEVLERGTEGGQERVRVAYKALMRRPGTSEPVESRSVWRFSRTAADPASHWKLEAVEQ